MSDTLSALSNAMAATVAQAGQHVVRVEARRRLPATGIVWSGDGIIVTSNHVVRRDDRIHVGLPNGDSLPATLVGRDPTTDVAVVKVEASDLSAASWVSSEQLKVGHLVLALGRPGQTVQATLGVISALGDGWQTSGGGRIDRYLQTDVVMYPGFSGGPLVGAGGQVAGLNTSGLLRGVSMALPSETIARVVNTLLTHGRVRRGYLGVGAQAAKLPHDVAEAVGQETGLLLVSVEEGSPAQEGGLTVGDIIIAVDNESVQNLGNLLSMLTGDRVGKTALIGIVRGGQPQELPVTIGERE